MKTWTKMSNAIDRIKGYCTEVNQAQWDELVRVADEVGVNVWNSSRNMGVCKQFNIAFTAESDEDLILTYKGSEGTRTFIPFPDFIAKLRGVEEWTPKQGEMVEVSDGFDEWQTLEFIAKRRSLYVCWWNESEDTAAFTQIRPLRPTITRAEAEAQLGKRIID